MDSNAIRKKRVQMVTKLRRSSVISRDRSRTVPELNTSDAEKVTHEKKALGKRNSWGEREYLAPIINKMDEGHEQPPVIPSIDALDKENGANIILNPLQSDKLMHNDNQLENINNNNNNITLPEDSLQDLKSNCISEKMEIITPAEQIATAVTELSPTDAGAAFNIGDLVWAFVPGCPLWPALITLDAADGLFTKFRASGKFQSRVYHVHFFADKGNYSWQLETAILPFTGGVEELMKDENFLKHVNSKSKLFKSLPQPNDNMVGRKKHWPTAIQEAKECLCLAKEERYDFLKRMVQLQLEQEQIQRKRKANSGEPKPKRRRQSKETPSPELEAQPEGAADQMDRSSSEASNSIQSISDMLLQQEDLADEVLREFKKMREKEKKSPEMKIEVCESCGTREGRSLPCAKCRTVYHPLCLGKDPEVSELLCAQCDPAAEATCCLCKQPGEELMTCRMEPCSRRYHRKCLAGFNSLVAKQDPAKFYCPAHHCHTCVAELAEVPSKPDKKQTLLRCVLCPTSFHTNEACLAAGCIQLSSTQMKCFKHVEKSVVTGKKGTKKRKSALPLHYNVNWCMVCTEGGSLICCERCPASFHTKCLGLDEEPDESYLCIECTSGKAILHGDIVWCKFGSYRWWPGRVYPLDVLPGQHQKHKMKVGEFLVYFYGSHNSAFVHRGQVFHYHDGDQGAKGSSKNQMAEDFKLALELVTPAFQQRQEELAQHSAQRRLKANKKPPSYNKIRSNKPIGSVRILETGPGASSPCDCDEEDPCGIDSACLNRVLRTECHPSICKPRCGNQNFQKRLTPPLYPFYTGGKGWGLKSKAPIKKGSFVVEYCGELIDNQEFQRRLKAKQDAGDEAYYFLTLDNHRIIDAGPSGNLARFMNHCCQPNCETQKWNVLGDTRVGLFALHDIPADTELTFNYQLECAQDVVNESNQRKQPCHCGAPNCAGFIGAKPKQLETEKVKKAPTKAKKPKPRKPAKAKVSEDLCFICDEGGSLVICDIKGCGKVYHTNCLTVPVPEKGNWTCPWHNCDVCSGKSTQFCAACPASLCSTHAAEANWKTREPLEGLLCDKHSMESSEINVQTPIEEETSMIPTPTSSSSPEPPISSSSVSSTSSEGNSSQSV